MEELNLIPVDKLQLLRGIPQVLNNICIVYPITIGDITSIGNTKFFRYLNLLTFSQEDVDNSLIELGIEEKITPFEFIMLSSKNQEFYVEIVKALSTFIKEEVVILPETKAIQIGDLQDHRLMLEDDFEIFQEILKAQNNLDEQDGELDNPSNEKAARIIEQLKKGREEREKNAGKGNVDFSDLVSCLAAKGNGINIFNIWELSYYSFNNMFKRLKMIEDYDMSIRSLLAGADPKKVEVKHWIRNINEK